MEWLTLTKIFNMCKFLPLFLPIITHSKQDKDVEMDEASITQKFLLKIADYCFTHNINGDYKEKLKYSGKFDPKDNGSTIGLTDLIGKHICDYTIEGVEHQVIAPDDFFNSLQEYGIEVDSHSDRVKIEKVLKVTSLDKR